MKKKTLVALFSIFTIGAFALLVFNTKNYSRLSSTVELHRHNITLDHTNRQDVTWVPDGEGGGKYNFSLVSVTENGNEYASNPYGCYVSAYRQNLIDINSDEYIFKVSMEEGYDNKCSLTLGFDARSDVKIGETMLETSEDRPIVMLELSYNDNVIHENVELRMNYSVGYASDVIFLEGSTMSITLYSVSINYSCTY